MKEIQFMRFAASLPVAEKASHAPPVHAPIVILALSVVDAVEQAAEAGLTLHGQIMKDGSVKPCKATS